MGSLAYEQRAVFRHLHLHLSRLLGDVSGVTFSATAHQAIRLAVWNLAYTDNEKRAVASMCDIPPLEFPRFVITFPKVVGAAYDEWRASDHS